MPFIVQCPHCHMYQLREDSDRGAQVKCLYGPCGGDLSVEPSGSGEWQSPPAPSREAGTAKPETPSIKAGQRHRVVTCPNCNAPLRVPPGQKGRVQCPRCQTVFAP